MAHPSATTPMAVRRLPGLAAPRLQPAQARVKTGASAAEVVSTRDSRSQLAFSGGVAGRLHPFSWGRL